MAKKQLILVVETTAAMGPYFRNILSDCLGDIIRNFCASEVAGQKQPASLVEFALVTYNAHGPYNAFLVQRSGWTRDVDNFFDWLRAIRFSGGGFNDAAIAEGLADAIMMVPPPVANQSQPNLDVQRHCILVAASNPYPLPTPVYRPPMPDLEQGENVEAPSQSRLADAEAVAKCFSYCAVTLSVIAPKQIPKLKAIYNAGKLNPRGTDLPVDNVKNPHYLVLISENFMEACAALNKSGTANIASTQSPVKMDIAPVPSVSGPPQTSVPPASGSIMNRQPVTVPNIPLATVKVEPTTVGSMVSGPFPHMPPVSRVASQSVPTLQTSSPLSVSQEMALNNDNVQDLKPGVSSMAQPLRQTGSAAANVSILNNLSQARQVMSSAALTGGTSMGLQSMGGSPMAVHMSNMISSGMTSSVSAGQSGLSSGPSAITSIGGGSGTVAGTAQVAQQNSSNISMSQPLSNLQGGVSVSMGPSLNQGNNSGPNMVQSGISMNQNMVGGLGAAGISAGTGSIMPPPGMIQQVQMGVQAMGVNSNSAANMSLPQQSASGSQSAAQSKYVKVWEGSLSGQRQGQPVFITRLEGYRNASADETLAANWPATMQIVRLISQDHMNNKQYVGKADFLVFRAMNQHGFLGQLQEKKLCAVIQLPSQTLLLSVSDKACRLIGMLFPGDMVVFKPQISSQQPQQQQGLPQMQQGLSQVQQQQVIPQMQQQQQQQQQTLLQMQQQKTLPQMQQQQVVGQGMGQGYGPGPARSQLVSQGQMASQGASTMPGGGFLN